MTPSHISVFDLDKTLFRVNSSFAFGLYLTRKRVFSHLTPLYLMGYRFLHFGGMLSIEQIHEKVSSRFLEGLYYPHLQQWVSAFLEEHFEGYLSQSVVERLREAQEEGHYTVILSSAPDFLVGPIAELFGVDEWGATMYGSDKQDCVSGVSSLMEGHAKAEYLCALAQRKKIPLSDVTAYTDSIADLPMLQVAGNIIGVNPDRQLRKYCRQQHWEIMR